MLTNAEKNEEVDEIVNDAEIPENVEINVPQDNKLANDIASSQNEKEFDFKERDLELNNKINGDSESDWSSSSSSSSSPSSDEKFEFHESKSTDPSEMNNTDAPNSSPSPHLSNNISSHYDGLEETPINYDQNGDIPAFDDVSVITPVKRVCKENSFKVKTLVNGLSAKNSQKIVENDIINEVCSLTSPDDDEEIDESPEVPAEYAQYLGLKPSVKFKCSRCGTKNFSTIALLQEHIASCSGQVPLTTVTSVSPVNSVDKSDTVESNATATNLRITRKVFLCSSCGTYYQSYNLYLHMREVHNKQICLFCLSMFCQSQQLSDHLISVHNLKLSEFSSVSQVKNAFKGSFYITCCTCNKIFCDEDRFHEHKCDTEADLSPTQVISRVTEDKKLPSSDDDSPESPLSPVNESPYLDQITEPEEIAKPETEIMETERISTPINESDVSEEHKVSEAPTEPFVNEISNDNDLENVEPPALENSSEQEKSELEQNPVNSGMDVNQVDEDYENRGLKDDSSDSEILNALFDHSEEPDEKVAQPLTMALMLDDVVATLSPQTIIKECVRTSCTSCSYCNNALLIAVNTKQLAKHLLSEHRYKPTKNEDDCEQVSQKIESCITEFEDVYMNATSNEFDGTFACFQCSFNTTLLKELCAHKRKAHQMNIFLCIVCKCNFIYYSELLCHECPGEYSSESYSLRFRCCFCSLNHIPSAFRLMVHLRKFHKACDFCLLRFNDQCELFSHMTKQHKMNHRCYKCDIAYSSRNDINKHLFWKHGTESVLCKRCLQKKWPHAYHFCMPASTYACEECNRTFTKAVALTVHRRAHTGDFPFGCECQQRFISKKLLELHQRRVHQIDKKDESLDTSNEKKENGSDSGISNEEQADDDKKRKKKKRKKVKMNEKPLLDELPPLNLSSESDESGPEEPSKSEPLKLPPPQSPLPMEEPPSPVTESVPEEPEKIELPLSGEVSETVEKTPDDFLERALNCLMVEHSYCIPDSIFHSEPVDNNDSKNKTPDTHNSSPHTSRSHDKSCCKSATPRKRKRNKKNSSAGESSSTASSSDSDSSSSSCGSNCSCNRSNSNCSSSSSGSEYSTTPEKKKSKSKDYKKSQKKEDEATEEQREQLFLLDARESDLDTDISTAGEDFYEERPCYIPPPSDKKIEYPPSVSEPAFEENVPITENKETKSRRNKDKKKKRKRIKLNLTGRIPPNYNPLKTNGSSSHLPTISIPRNEFINEEPVQYAEEKPQIQSDTSLQNCINTDASLDDPNSSRLSKRKRVKNKFYGYSSSDESRDMTLPKTVPKKRVLTKKSNPKNRHFVGIRAKQLPPLPKRLSVSVPFTPVNVTQTLEYKPSVPNYNSYPNRYSSSEDSDSDEKRHALVINLPAIKEKITNNYQPPVYSDESASSNSWVSSPRAEVPQSSVTSFHSPLKSDLKVYCYCQCPYDEVSEMIACDGPNCKIEWFHFECVGIMVPPKGKWYCPSCRRNRENVSRFV